MPGCGVLQILGHRFHFPITGGCFFWGDWLGTYTRRGHKASVKTNVALHSTIAHYIGITTESLSFVSVQQASRAPGHQLCKLDAGWKRTQFTEWCMQRRLVDYVRSSSVLTAALPGVGLFTNSYDFWRPLVSKGSKRSSGQVKSCGSSGSSYVRTHAPK